MDSPPQNPTPSTTKSQAQCGDAQRLGQCLWKCARLGQGLGDPSALGGFGVAWWRSWRTLVWDGVSNTRKNGGSISEGKKQCACQYHSSCVSMFFVLYHFDTPFFLARWVKNRWGWKRKFWPSTQQSVPLGAITQWMTGGYPASAKFLLF